MITFPSLNIELQINPVALTIGNIEIYWYAIIIVVAIIMALEVMKINDNKFGIRFNTIIDLAVYLIPISFIGARIYYVLFNPQAFIEEPMQVFNLRNRWNCNIWSRYSRCNYLHSILQKKKTKMFRLVRLYSPKLSIGTGNWKMGKLYKPRGVWNAN